MENNEEVREPDVDYNTGKAMRLKIFKSFEEEQEAQYTYWRSLSPEQRLEEHRILSTYVFSGYEKYTGNRLTFD